VTSYRSRARIDGRPVDDLEQAAALPARIVLMLD
jgi:hypothetical protein